MNLKVSISARGIDPVTFWQWIRSLILSTTDPQIHCFIRHNVQQTITAIDFPLAVYRKTSYVSLVDDNSLTKQKI